MDKPAGYPAGKIWVLPPALPACLGQKGEGGGLSYELDKEEGRGGGGHEESSQKNP